MTCLMHCFLRQQIELAKMFEEKVLKDERFEVHGNATMGLVCFRLQVFLNRYYDTIQYDTMQYNNTLLILKKEIHLSAFLTNNNKYIKTLLNTIQYDTMQYNNTLLILKKEIQLSALDK